MGDRSKMKRKIRALVCCSLFRLPSWAEDGSLAAIDKRIQKCTIDTKKESAGKRSIMPSPCNAKAGSR